MPEINPSAQLFGYLAHELFHEHHELRMFANHERLYHEFGEVIEAEDYYKKDTIIAMVGDCYLCIHRNGVFLTVPDTHETANITIFKRHLNSKHLRADFGTKDYKEILDTILSVLPKKK